MKLPLTARIFTFYSFKGGVGRSMALLNCAYVLAGIGRRVLMVDMDLEAPGLSYLIERQEKQRQQPSGSEESGPIFRQGLVELIAACADSPGDWPLARRADAGRIEEYLTDLAVPETVIRAKAPGRLSVLPAGRIDADYESRLAAIPWHEEPLRTQRDNLFRHLRNQILAADLFDYVLVDARTGFSDEGYLAARIMADHLIVLCGMNQQNVLGTCQFLRQVQTWPQPESGDARKVVLVLSPVPEWEEDAKKERRAEIRQLFLEQLGAETPFSHELPYHPRVAMWEEAIVGQWPNSSLARAYQELSRRVRQLAHDLPEHWGAWLADLADFNVSKSNEEIQQRADQFSTILKEAREQVDLEPSVLWPVLNRIQTEAARLHKAQRFGLAEPLWRLAVAVADVLSDERSLLESLIWQGRTNRLMGRYPQARQALDRALQVSQGQDDKRLRASALFNLAELERWQGNYVKARRAHQKSLAMKRDLRDRRGIAVALHSLAELDRLQGNYTEARRGYEKSLAMKEGLGNRRGISITLHTLAELDRLQGNYAEARRGYEKSLAMKRKLGDHRGIVLSELYAASCSASLREQKSLTRLQDLVSRSAHEIEGPTVPLRGQILLAETFIGLERYSEALTALEAAVASLRQLGLRGLLADAEAIKAIAHEGLGQHDRAVSAARSAVAFFDEQQVRSPFRERLDRILSGDSGNT